MVNDLDLRVKKVRFREFGGKTESAISYLSLPYFVSSEGQRFQW